MEASVAGGVPAAPAAADGGLPGSPAPAQPAAPAEIARSDLHQHSTPANDIASRLDAMETQSREQAERFNEFMGQQAQQPSDLVSALMGDDDGGLTPEEVAAQQAPAGQEQDDAAHLAALDAYVQEQVEKALEPERQRQQDADLRSFQERNPDIMQPEIFDAVVATLDNFVQRYGEGARTDVGLVEMAYKAVKAEQADAGAVPAGQAANHGASIETQAGQSQQGEASVDEDYINHLVGGGGGDAFT